MQQPHLMRGQAHAHRTRQPRHRGRPAAVDRTPFGHTAAFARVDDADLALVIAVVEQHDAHAGPIGPVPGPQLAGAGGGDHTEPPGQRLQHGGPHPVPRRLAGIVEPMRILRQPFHGGPHVPAILRQRRQDAGGDHHAAGIQERPQPFNGVEGTHRLHAGQHQNGEGPAVGQTQARAVRCRTQQVALVDQRIVNALPGEAFGPERRVPAELMGGPSHPCGAQRVQHRHMVERAHAVEEHRHPGGFVGECPVGGEPGFEIHPRSEIEAGVDQHPFALVAVGEPERMHEQLAHAEDMVAHRLRAQLSERQLPPSGGEVRAGDHAPEVLFHDAARTPMAAGHRVAEFGRQLGHGVAGVHASDVAPGVDAEIVESEVRPGVVGHDCAGRIPGGYVAEHLVPAQQHAVPVAPLRERAEERVDPPLRVPFEERHTPRGPRRIASGDGQQQRRPIPGVCLLQFPVERGLVHQRGGRGPLVLVPGVEAGVRLVEEHVSDGGAHMRTEGAGVGIVADLGEPAGRGRVEIVDHPAAAAAGRDQEGHLPEARRRRHAHARRTPLGVRPVDMRPGGQVNGQPVRRHADGADQRPFVPERFPAVVHPLASGFLQVSDVLRPYAGDGAGDTARRTHRHGDVEQVAFTQLVPPLHGQSAGVAGQPVVFVVDADHHPPGGGLVGGETAHGQVVVRQVPVPRERQPRLDLERLVAGVPHRLNLRDDFRPCGDMVPEPVGRRRVPRPGRRTRPPPAAAPARPVWSGRR